MTNFTTAARTSTTFKKVALRVAFGLGMAAMAASASAHRITTTYQNYTGYYVSGNDLLTGLTGVMSGNVNSEESLFTNTSGSALNDGMFGQLNIDGGANPGMVLFHENASVTYTLAPSAAGYTIDAINSFSGWRDTGRVEQDYSVAFAFASNPTNFINQFTVASTAPTANDMAVSTSHPGTVLGSNVAAIRFTFTGVQNGYVGYRELDVFGSAAAAPIAPSDVPEPASLALFGLGAVAMTALRRRRSAK